MATDGFMDQFGSDETTGGKIKRFGKKRFIELIRESSRLSFKQQRNLLIRTFKAYKKGEESMDDVTVVAFGLD